MRSVFKAPLGTYMQIELVVHNGLGGWERWEDGRSRGVNVILHFLV